MAALRALGLQAKGLKKLPMALVTGSVAQMAEAVTSGLAQDVYPDERLSYDDTVSSNTMSSSPKAAETLRKKGLTGKGVTVGIVDSGCDATHPDLAKRVVHNVILFSPEYVNAGTTPIVPVPIGMTPYNNTDLGSGHGTHVGGIVAADGSSGKANLGVAPDAKLACFAIGAVITTTAVVSAYDYMLSQPKMLGIDVVNNSWGNSFRQYDPKDPVNVATKAVSKKGAVVVFAAGNSGSENGEGTVSPFNQAPWVLSIAAGSVDRVRGDFSVQRPAVRQRQARRDRPGRTHRVHRGPDRGHPARPDRPRCRHLLAAATAPAPSSGPAPTTARPRPAVRR